MLSKVQMNHLDQPTEIFVASSRIGATYHNSIVTERIAVEDLGFSTRTTKEKRHKQRPRAHDDMQ